MRRPNASRRRRIPAILCTFLWGIVGCMPGAAGEWANEYQLKAAFVYKMMFFVEWPAGALGARVVVGFAGEGAMGKALTDSIQGKKLGAIPIEVRTVRTEAEIRDCNVLVIAYPDASRTREALSFVRNASVLTIGDGEGFARMGGGMALVPYQNTFQLAVNARAVDRARLKVSAKLLSLAKMVPEEEFAVR